MIPLLTILLTVQAPQVSIKEEKAGAVTRWVAIDAKGRKLWTRPYYPSRVLPMAIQGGHAFLVSTETNGLECVSLAGGTKWSLPVCLPDEPYCMIATKNYVLVGMGTGTNGSIEMTESAKRYIDKNFRIRAHALSDGRQMWDQGAFSFGRPIAFVKNDTFISLPSGANERVGIRLMDAATAKVKRKWSILARDIDLLAEHNAAHNVWAVTQHPDRLILRSTSKSDFPPTRIYSNEIVLSLKHKQAVVKSARR